MTTATETYNPFMERNVRHPTTDLETFLLLLKGAIGAGIMAMPIAFRHIGLWAGMPGQLFVCTLAIYCMHLLVRASQTLCFRCRIPSLSYSDTAEQAFRSDPEKPSKWGIAMRFIVSVFLVCNAMGCVCVYFLNTGRHLEQFFDGIISINLRLWILIALCPMLFLSLIRDLKYLVPFSAVANIFIFTSIIITSCFILRGLPNPSERRAIAEPEMWPSFFSISTFALEVVNLVIPCENEMKKPQHFTGCPSVLVVAMGLVSIMYTLLGFFGYWKYGDLIEPNIILNLPNNNYWAEAAKIMVACSVYFTILIQYFVAIQTIWNALKPYVAEKWQLLTECTVRIGLMSICASMAAGFPDLGPFMSLVGAVTFSTLGFTFPALIDLMVIRTDPGYGFLKFRLIKDILILIFGLSIFVAGSIESIYEFRMNF